MDDPQPIELPTYKYLHTANRANRLLTDRLLSSEHAP
jgi:hypothetical protein